jgi:UDP-N-acetylmuramyl pentapeptide phosphotransferase/UDP-N-acetylglucosamine-1-phosphate transferase
LCVHVFAGLLLGWLAWRDGAGWFWSLLVVGLTAALVNIWNFMDGINGLAVSQAALVAAALALWLPADTALAGWLVVLACLVFLPFNFPRARIFLGDVGSGALGLLMAALALLVLRRGVEVNPVMLLWPMSVFLVDAGFTLLSRICQGQRWTQAHTEHLYQWFAKTGRSHLRITLAYAAITTAVAALAMALPVRPGWLGMVASIVLWLSGAALWQGLRSSLQQRGK